MLDAVQARYGRAITVYRPDAAAVQAHVQAHGAYAFYESVELRKACCQIRKVEPLKRALAGRRALHTWEAPPPAPRQGRGVWNEGAVAADFGGWRSFNKKKRQQPSTPTDAANETNIT